MKNTFSTGYRRPSLLPDAQQRKRLQRWRKMRDYASRSVITLAGIAVVLALAGMFIYLFSEAAALFSPVSVKPQSHYVLPLAEQEKPLYLALDNHNETAVLLSDKGKVQFFALAGGNVLATQQVLLPENTVISNWAATDNNTLVLALNNGKAMVVQLQFGLAGASSATADYPLGREPLLLSSAAIESVAIRQHRDALAIAALSNHTVTLHLFSRTQAALNSKSEWQHQQNILPVAQQSRSVLLDGSLRYLYVLAGDAQLQPFSGEFPQNMQALAPVNLLEPGGTITRLQWLAGAYSLLAADNHGHITQWFPVPEQGLWQPARIRSFDPHSESVSKLMAEHGRRGFLSLAENGELAIHHATGGNTLYRKILAGINRDSTLALSPDNSRLLAVAENGAAQVYQIHNPHPDVSWQAMWQRIWYEGRPQPDLVWQSSSASDTFEPKLSLVPLVSGTLKATLFAMLFAVPLAIMAAIYSAYFITPALRGKIKPAIELMEAMPTVILGFLAALWLAPFIEQHLPVLLLLLLLLPLSVLLFSLLWHCRPAFLQRLSLNGWEAVLLIPLLLLTVYICVVLSPLIEQWWFAGSLRQWLTDHGIHYQQRNAIIIGIAMGFAVIPGIFSLADDAIFHVPRHLTQGSLALGANHWQTLWRVVLVTASPGIFSAVMIGFGRAIGETMIVLMATGNSPLLGFNPLEGMRTLAATLAMELPEAAVGSSHFRILFLAALLLFVITFTANTIAELVRQRLRRRYSAIQAGVQ